MIGKIYKALTPYYDSSTKSMRIKSRPALIIANSDAEDYVVLPISSITHKEKIDAQYDMQIDPRVYPKSNLTKVSYVRTHKQTVIHQRNLGGEISDLRAEYEDFYLEILQKRREFSDKIDNLALL